ncbi:hypothetical protein ACTVZO_00950 [Streptomyces sp. IBSNAI002]|uniref:hypothetical protein n=1 Tax=Streptomyces sp. IBSNAI002 TaxID=3457500 RepID=UPI003FD092C6
MFTVIAVLAPVLSGASAALFFLVGLVLEVVSSESGLGRTLFDVGSMFVAVASASIVVCVVGLVVTALRSGRDRPVPEAGLDGEPVDEEVARAGEAWRNALLERGIVPFLSSALADPVAPRAETDSRGPGRIPNLGYSRPDFTSPSSGSQPATGSPSGYTRPDFASPEHRPE